MTDIFIDPAFAPFGLAIGFVVFLAIVEVASALAGLSASQALETVLPDLDADLDVDVDADIDTVTAGEGPSFFQSALAWLCVGKVPSLVVLIVFLTAFGITGFVAQSAARALLGVPLPVIIPAALAVFAALPLTRTVGLTIARVMPREYSEAASQNQFVGRTATVIRGEARRGQPAEAKVTGPFGKTHYILIEPDTDDDVAGQGEELVIVSQEGAVYRGVQDFDAFVATGL
ncbi:MAG: YqiJ family protein [Pseudomonadota bacterium]